MKNTIKIYSTKRKLKQKHLQVDKLLGIFPLLKISSWSKIRVTCYFINGIIAVRANLYEALRSTIPVSKLSLLFLTTILELQVTHLS